MKRMVMTALATLGATAACDREPMGPAPLMEPALTSAVAVDVESRDAAWTDRWQERIEVHGDHWVPCANGGAGEFVEFSGTVLLTEQIVVTDGRYSYRIRWTPQNLVGHGVETGDLYREVGGIAEKHIGGDKGGTLLTLDEAYRMISPGSGDNFFYRFTGQLHYTPDGDLVVDRIGESIECR